MTTTVSLAGSTGSIGTQSLEVIAAEPDRFEVVALGASGRNLDQLVAQAEAVRPRVVAVADEAAAAEVADRLPQVEVRAGTAGLASLGAEADVCVNGVVGFAGLEVTLATLLAGKRLALANKESLIAGGPVVQRARRTPGAELVPVDSEHGAIHQCLRSRDESGPARVHRLVLTASGGPFRGRSKDDLASVGIDDALAHPTWSMGPKITIDSSTLMNKGLEVIEAHELFGAPAGDAGVGIGYDQIEVVVHPQSIVHSMVSYTDGSTIAQLSNPTMKLPIGYALAWPDRLGTAFGAIDWTELARLDFEAPDLDAFPCLALAYQAGRAGGLAPAWLNAANEEAVAAFLDGAIRWVDIAAICAAVLDRRDDAVATTFDDVVEADRRARAAARSVMADQHVTRTPTA
ncbi:1-deoxy-D-xylulose-5-phosphate reductoisomerase [Aquihabitans sp. G128]|uniref:1-deoxy-D-xylulose-5-phosphate reductoisomerase n=1 Tax=Aquihabitans sp. G128 TaxID=2849779 RepID=UPI001C2217A4|nr:1-deoxy-D-xylulose-5-phosphate reductoisomerase [Aquihabitans sp. G128]QXC62605.1 1-deoxy-D-xylulose-5-phosphate reductoisomerase [Aquihabitans sp. G128]